MDFRPDILPTEDGSNTLHHPVLGETYHSTRGAVGESEHVFIRQGFDHIDQPHIRVFEMGFGSGLNALLTLKRARKLDKTVDYHAVELFPVSWETVGKLNYIRPMDPDYAAFQHMHSAVWDAPVEITRYFTLQKTAGSLLETDFDTIFDVIYFDAFAPDTQPDLWTAAVFRKLYEHTATGGILVTYSAKGSVKEALRTAGYEVKRLQGALGKRHMIRAEKR